ncbi:hypothetical protein KOR34_02040 [Posidoniimonas corsicana]|uniref:Uncharacterized protein n=1 Tax=Posidoniimonas corsicana TaxID=1938618 RepID=A0A5C5V9P5_9BACT|nr:hypothetical protein [Posidoniimonas corsicana]TWT35314.1 hypothetical protein KOR34_02040 [Posidoniimonas corsicana]
MSAVATLELINDSEEAPSRTYWVEDDADPGGATVSESAAMAAVLAVAPASIDGAYAGPLSRQQINDHYWRVSLSYSRRLRYLTPLQAATEIRGFQFRAKPKRYEVGAPVAKAPSVAPDLPDDLVGFDWQGSEYVHRGVLVTPPSIADTVRFIIPNTAWTGTYISLIQAMCVDPGAWNSAPFQGRPAGSVCLVAASIQQRDDASYAAQLGFGYDAGFSYTFLGDTLNLQGGDQLQLIKRTKTVTVASRKLVVPNVRAAYQLRLPPRADLNNLIL